MSNNRDLLKEAIADAKAVKETAIANAKAALEEAFTPHLKSMLSAKLEEMDKEDVEEKYDKYEEDDVKEEISTELDEAKKEDKDEVKESEEVAEENKVDEEVNLDELLAEINEDEEVTESEEIEEAKEEIDEAKDEDKDEVKESEEIEETEKVTEEEEVEDEIEVKDEESEGEMEDEEIDLEDMSEDDLKGFIEDVIKDMVEAGELEAGDEMEMDDEESDMDIDIEVEDEEVEVMEEEKEEKLEEMDEVSWNEKNNPTRGASKKELDPKKVGQSTSAYAVNLEEALAQVEELKEEIKEVNLLNAKLLYTNKIFKAKNLSEDKKLRVLKAFDKASTVKEAKVVFETLNEGITNKVSKSINEVKGSASKATGTAPSAKQPIVESDAMVDRFKKLAGII
tara:strand:+ start:290 stop:1477 length:1188 start_codon:yes stop_codon:yes gene_type:complete